MEPKGTVLIRRKFTHTKLWPADTQTEQEYKEALAGEIATVMDVAVDGSGYLVIGKTKTGAYFLWTIEKEDTYTFLPIVKKDGVIVPCGLSPMDEAIFMATAKLNH